MAIDTSSPGLLGIFKSFYYVNTYLEAIDLEKTYASQEGNEEARATASRLISQDGVKEIFSSTFSYIPAQYLPYNQVLKSKGFTLLSKKPVDLTMTRFNEYFSVSEHPDLQGWVIKAGGARVASNILAVGGADDVHDINEFGAEDSLLRLAMRDRIEKVAQKHDIEVALPKKYLVKYEEPTGPALTQKYCVISEKLDVQCKEGFKESIAALPEAEQRELAQKIVTVIKESGFVDTNLDNITFTREGKLCILDTEPVGLMKAKGGTTWTTYSVEKCARMGLFNFGASLMRQDTNWFTGMKSFSIDEKLAPFTKVIHDAYKEAKTPKLSKWKIVASIICPLIPIVYAVMTLAIWIISFINGIILFFYCIANSQQSQEQQQTAIGPAAKRGLFLMSGITWDGPQTGQIIA